MCTEFHNCRSKGSGEMLVQSLHFQTVAKAPPFGQYMYIFWPSLVTLYHCGKFHKRQLGRCFWRNNN